MSHTSLPNTLYTAAQIHALETAAIHQQVASGLELMQRAGSAAFQSLRQHWPEAHAIVVVCGLGNNAGDGYVIAHLAQQSGRCVLVLQLGDVNQLQGDARTAYHILRDAGGEIKAFDIDILQGADVVVDAIFGTGLNRDINGIWADAVLAINQLSIPIFSIDIPSGLEADTGSILGIVVCATLTMTFVGLKLGLFTGEGAACCGKLLFADLRLPQHLYDNVQSTARRWDEKDLARYFVPRKRTAHKGHYGSVLLIGGEIGMSGAIRLAAAAASRVGAGKISIATREEHVLNMNILYPEIMCYGVKDGADLTALMAAANVIAIGPGLGMQGWGHTMLNTVIQQDKPLVVDADALNLLAKTPIKLEQAIVTPHPGEAARLLGEAPWQVQKERLLSAQTIQKRYGGICVLKGTGTLCVDEQQHINLCSAGNPGMASGGMGDVLTGIIAGLLAQGFTPEIAAPLGVCVHAVAADKAAEQGERGLLASDVIKELRACVNV